MRLLLTGRPGVGKTTAVRRLAELLGDRRLAGFYTLEMRVEGRRRGFRAVTFDNHEWVIADVAFSGPPRVGKYGVDVVALDELAEHSLSENPQVELVIVDEIGKMECYSEVFVRRVRRLLEAGRSLVATVAQHGTGLIAEVQRREDCVLWQVTMANRDSLPGRIVTCFQSQQR